MAQQASEPEFDVGLVDALAQLSFLVQGTLSQHAAAQDLSIIQTRLLGILQDREPTMLELARLLELDKSSVTGLVDRAERRGLVQRTPSTDDRRAIRVKLTALGRRTGVAIRAGFQADVMEATRCLSEGEKKDFSTLATRVINQRAAQLGSTTSA